MCVVNKQQSFCKGKLYVICQRLLCIRHSYCRPVTQCLIPATPQNQLAPLTPATFRYQFCNRKRYIINDLDKLVNYYSTMLEYVKLILLKVSFDKMLFEKELVKGLKMLKKEELLHLKQWCSERFTDMHLLIVNRAFAGV